MVGRRSPEGSAAWPVSHLRACLRHLQRPDGQYRSEVRASLQAHDPIQTVNRQEHMIRSRQSIDRNTGSVDRNTGSIQRNTGPIHRNTGSIHRNAGSVDRNTGSIDRNTGSIDRNTGSIHRNTGSIDKTMGSRDNNAGSTDRIVRPIHLEAVYLGPSIPTQRRPCSIHVPLTTCGGALERGQVVHCVWWGSAVWWGTSGSGVCIGTSIPRCDNRAAV